MRTVDLIQRKRGGEELCPEEIEFLVNGYTTGEIPDYQMSAFLMAVFFSGMRDGEVSRMTECMSKKLAEGIDALVLDVKVGSGAFMKKQVDARRLAQTMVGIGRRMDKKVQALITDMNQPLGYAIGNALEIMEASQTLQNAGPSDLTKLSLELAARMIFLGKKSATLEEARMMAEKHLVDGSAYKKFKQVVAAQGGNPQALDKFELLPNATGMREVTSPRAGYVSRINAQDIGVSSNMIGAGRDKKEDSIDPAVGIILEVKMGEKVDAGSVLCRIYYT